MKQFNTPVSTEEVEYSVEFPKKPEYTLKRGKLFLMVCQVIKKKKQ